MLAPLLSVLLLGTICAPPDSGAAPPAAAGKNVPSPEVEAARAALLEAKRHRRLGFGKEDEEKRRILIETVDLYDQVRKRHGEVPEVAAEAAFRMGEILRSLGDADRARAAFSAAAQRGTEAPEFAARAALEIAHLDRRAGGLEAAEKRYAEVAQQFAAQEKTAARALTWLGKVKLRRGDAEGARAAWLEVADRFPSQPVAAVRAADLAALSALEEGDTAKARSILETLERRFSPDGGAGEWWSPDVEAALSKMKAKKRLREIEADPERRG